MGTPLHDLRYAARTLLKSPGFTIPAILTLALGIGANTAVFSVVDGVLLRPLPYPEPERVVYLGWEFGERGYNSFLTAYKYQYIREHSQAFEGVSTHRTWATDLGAGQVPDEVQGLRATADFFRVNGIRPALGRSFLEEEDRPGAAPVVVLSDALWRSRFAADPGVLDRTVLLGGEPHTVVGILPPEFRFPEAADYTQFVVPYRLDPDPRDGGSNYLVRARIREGVTPERLQADLRSVFDRFRGEHPELVGRNDTGVLPLDHAAVFVGDTANTLWILLGAVGFVLLIACANVANLLLARSAGRQREMAVRAAIGAGRGRIVRQLLAESLVLAAAAAALGLVIGQWSLDSLLALAPSSLPRAEEIGLDGRVLGFTAAIALATGVLFGLTAAVHASRTDLNSSLRDGGSRNTADRARHRVRSAFAASEAALAMVLLTGAGLLVVSFFQLRGVDPGLDPDGMLAIEFRRTPAEYGSAQDVWRFERQVVERLRTIPGVIAAGATSTLPLSGNQYNFPMTVVGNTEATRGDVQWRAISPEYFETLRIGMVSGRGLTEADGPASPPVVVINETFARKYFDGRDPIGQRIDIGTYAGEEVIPGFDEPEREIVGVVADVRALGLDRGVTEAMYIPRSQAPDRIGSLGALVVRARLDAALAPAVLRELRAIDPRMPAPRFRAMAEVIGASMAQERFNTVLLGAFAGLALLLTAIGIYGVVAYTVRQRTGEIGIRMALGADCGGVLRLVVRQGMTPVAIGLGIGLVAAWALTRLITGLLYGVSPTDPATFTGVAAVIAGVALLATYIPARRAAMVDPVVALKTE